MKRAAPSKAIAFNFERHDAGVRGDQAAIGDGDTVRVAREYLRHRKSKSKAPWLAKVVAGCGWIAALSAFTYFNAADNITRGLAGDEMAKRMAMVQIKS